jgi:UDP-2,3-diacylglucosamine pyrophosphatase LpxH
VQRGRLLAISDVHFDTWCNQQPEVFADKQRAFLEFLDWVRDGSECEHFAIVGDLIDIPGENHAPLLPAFEKVAVKLYSLMRAGISVHYAIGNHDAGGVGIDINSLRPPLQISYPEVRVQCGENWVWLEHGHMLDAWLWEYVHRQVTSLTGTAPREAMRHFLPDFPADHPTTPAAAAVHDLLYEALQWRPDPRLFSVSDKRLGLRVMSEHLRDDFAEVADPGQRPPFEDEIAESLARHGVTVDDLLGPGDLPAGVIDLFMIIGGRYYSPLPWRRAARRRLEEVRRREGSQFTGIIMGHIHAPDCYQWTDETGTALTYANCGTWIGDSGSYVLVDNQSIKAVKRQWADPLPGSDQAFD